MAERVDVLVIGGGIHGVGVAQAAAAAGHSVMLIEKNELASGTSSKSSKLIHGGLRYLEQGSIALVYECLRERALLLKLAPDLVSLRAFYLPVYAATRRKAWQIRAGLSLYALLGGLRSESRFRKLSNDEWSQLDGLRTDGLNVVFQYSDAQTDDAQLTQAVMNSAQSLGAHLMERAQLLNARIGSDGCSSTVVHDEGESTVRSQVIVNASGPWIGDVLNRIEGAPSPLSADLVQGTHIVLKRGSVRGIYYVEAPQDGRAVFVMPWKDTVMIGTTEHTWLQSPDDSAPTSNEIEYLITVGRHYFGEHLEVSAQNIAESFAGLRVLPSGEGKANKKSRETILQVDDAGRPRVLSIYGGKLTAYRATALKVMRRLAATLPRRQRVAQTSELTLALPDC